MITAFLGILCTLDGLCIGAWVKAGYLAGTAIIIDCHKSEIRCTAMRRVSCSGVLGFDADTNFHGASPGLIDTPFEDDDHSTSDWVDKVQLINGYSHDWFASKTLGRNSSSTLTKPSPSHVGQRPWATLKEKRPGV